MKDRRFLVILSLFDTAPTRIQNVVPVLKRILERLSPDGYEQAFRSITADAFGYLIKTHLSVSQIRATIESPDDNVGWPFLNNKDGLFVIEIGSEFSGNSVFTRAAMWLQRH